MYCTCVHVHVHVRVDATGRGVNRTIHTSDHWHVHSIVCIKHAKLSGGVSTVLQTITEVLSNFLHVGLTIVHVQDPQVLNFTFTILMSHHFPISIVLPHYNQRGFSPSPL